jgi:hypothetical protein
MKFCWELGIEIRTPEEKKELHNENLYCREARAEKGKDHPYLKLRWKVSLHHKAQGNRRINNKKKEKACQDQEGQGHHFTS